MRDQLLFGSISFLFNVPNSGVHFIIYVIIIHSNHIATQHDAIKPARSLVSITRIFYFPEQSGAGPHVTQLTSGQQQQQGPGRGDF